MGGGKGKGRRRGGQSSNTQSPAGGPEAAPSEAAATVTAGAAAAVAAAAVQQSRRSHEFESFLDRVKKQVEFYFSDANMRRDAFLQRKVKEGQGYVDLPLLLSFNRIKSLRCFNAGQLVQAIRKSDMLVLSEDKTKVARDTAKAPVEEVDTMSRIVYIEGLPITFGIDDLTVFFARHGRVSLVELPRHRQTREPRGFCFVEYATNVEAAAAVTALNGTWPSSWPERNDKKTLRVMPKSLWQIYKKEFEALQHAARRGTPQRVEGAGIAAATAPASSSTAPASASDATAPDSAETAATAAPATSSSAQPRIPRGCLIRISGFSQPQTRLSLRQFAEHAVPVEYCDFESGDPQGYLRLRCVEDCNFLLQDLEQTNRQLGWLRPQVSILLPGEEEIYWQEVASRRAARAAEAPAPQPANVERQGRSKRKRRQSQQMFPNPQGVVIAGPSKTTTVQRFSSELELGRHKRSRAGSAPNVGSAAASSSQSGSFVDSAGGDSTFGQAGFGKPRSFRKRIFGTRSRLKKASDDLPAVPMPRGLKNVWIAPNSPAQANRGRANRGLTIPPLLKRDAVDLDLGPPPTKVMRQAVSSDLWMPPPSPGPASWKPQRSGSAPLRLEADMMFPPPSPVPVPQATAKRKKSPMRESARMGTLLLPPPSPIARPPDYQDERRLPAAATTGTTAVAAAAGNTNPASAAAASSSTLAEDGQVATAAGAAATEEVPKQDLPKTYDSMLDEIDLDELESLLD